MAVRSAPRLALGSHTSSPPQEQEGGGSTGQHHHDSNEDGYADGEAGLFFGLCHRKGARETVDRHVVGARRGTRSLELHPLASPRVQADRC